MSLCIRSRIRLNNVKGKTVFEQESKPGASPAVLLLEAVSVRSPIQRETANASAARCSRVEDAETAAQGRLAVAEDIVSKADPGTPLKAAILDQRAAMDAR